MATRSYGCTATPPHSLLGNCTACRVLCSLIDPCERRWWRFRISLGLSKSRCWRSNWTLHSGKASVPLTGFWQLGHWQTYHSRDNELNSRSEVLSIQASQKDWPATKRHRTSAFRRYYWSKQQHLAWNRKRSQAFKIRSWLKKKNLSSSARPYHFYLKH